MYYLSMVLSGGSRIFPRGVRQLPKLLLFFNFFAKNCVKMKEFEPGGGGGASPRGSTNGTLSKMSQEQHKKFSF